MKVRLESEKKCCQRNLCRIKGILWSPFRAVLHVCDSIAQVLVLKHVRVKRIQKVAIYGTGRLIASFTRPTFTGSYREPILSTPPSHFVSRNAVLPSTYVSDSNRRGAWVVKVITHFSPVTLSYVQTFSQPWLQSLFICMEFQVMTVVRTCVTTPYSLVGWYRRFGGINRNRFQSLRWRSEAVCTAEVLLIDWTCLLSRL
jgi:hypothetical protein